MPEGLDVAVGSKEESFDCEMVESFVCGMVPVEQAVVQIDLMVYRPRHRMNLHLRQPVL